MFSTVDLRFREQSSLIVYCRKINEDFYYDVYNRETSTHKQLVMPRGIAQQYFELYDTFEIIEPANMKELELEYIKDDPVALLLKVKEVSNVIRNDLEVITHDSVKFGLMSKGYPISLEKYVYLYLKAQVKI